MPNETPLSTYAKCSGCYSCEQICPKSCIKMVVDQEGFWYPVVDKQKCINCHLCERACPIVTPLTSVTIEQPKAYAAYNLNEEIRAQSSSGGVFTALAEYVLSLGGVVFGAAFQDDFSVSHICVETAEQLNKLRGSKYLQSKIGNTYKEAKGLLDSGRIVLFTGTPCQIEGLLAFLGKEYDNLYTQDLICHGVPSPMVWQKYVKYREKKAASTTRRTFFRHKNYGWKMYSVQFEFTNCTEYIQAHDVDLYMTSFLRNWCLRPSCYACHFKKKNRLSDITLADFWGIENVCPEMDDDKGTSLVLVNSKRGNLLFDKIQNNLAIEKVDFEKSIEYNPSMVSSCSVPQERDRFLDKMQRCNFEKCFNCFLPHDSLGRKIYVFLACWKKKIVGKVFK